MGKPQRKDPAELRAKLAAQRERMKRSAELKKAQAKLGELSALQDDEDPGDEIEDLKGLNKAVEKVGKERARKNKLSGEELEKWKANRDRVRQIRERQADAGYYTIVCFDTSGQCQAWIDFLKAQKLIPASGDLFIDGRILAASMGCKVPAPEYEMTTSVALAQGETKAMPKIPKRGKQ